MSRVCMRVRACVCAQTTHDVEDMTAQIKPNSGFVVVHGQRVWVLVQGARMEPVCFPHVGAGLFPHNDRACRRTDKGARPNAARQNRGMLTCIPPH